MAKYVIIGNSAAAVGAVEAIRQHDQASEVAIVSDEKHPVYSRPLISYYLADKSPLPSINYRPRNFYSQHKVKTFLGNKAKKIDFKSKIVFLENGKQIPYEKLLLATGGTPFIPPMKGLKKKGVFSFTQIEDAKKIHSLLGKIENAAVIGGGLIGLKATEALTLQGVKVTVVELAERVLSLVLDKKGSQLIQEIFESKGVQFITAQTATEIISKRGKSAAGGVVIEDGRKIPADIVIVAIGVRPRLELVQASQVKVNRGILVNEKMETSVKNVYAAGDVTEGFDRLQNINRPIPIWPQAYLQGRVAGLNMAGHNETFPGGIAMNATTFFGYPVISVGLCNPLDEQNYEILKKSEARAKVYKRAVLKDGRLVGFVMAGEVGRAGLLLDLIKEKAKVTSYKRKLLSSDFNLAYLPKTYRKRKLFLKEAVNEKSRQAQQSS